VTEVVHRRGARDLGVQPEGGSSYVALDDLPDAVLVVDPDGYLLGFNAAAAALCRPDPAVGKLLTDALPLRDEHGNDWWECLAGARRLSTVRRSPERLLTGVTDSLLVTAKYVRDPQGRLRHVVLVARDTVARERQERNAADLVSTVAHELRSPLTSVKGFTATLLAKWDRFSDEQKQIMLQTVNADADRVTRLISELLDVSRIDSGRLELHKQVVDVAAAIQRAFDGRVAGGEPADRFILEAHGELPEMWVDPDKLDQVVNNLVENGLRHGEGVVRVTVEPAGDGCAVTVCDEGEGVDEAVQSLIFGKFWRARRRGGTGLGLFICKGIVEAHGGRISVGRSQHGGAEFRFVLPAGTPSFL
jgi:signal transduction histidine kinase